MNEYLLFATKAAIVKSFQRNDLQKLNITKPLKKSTAVKITRGKGQIWEVKRITRNSTVVSQIGNLASDHFSFEILYDLYDY